MSEFQKTKKGFSLVEVLIALVVLTIGIVAVSSLMVVNIKSSNATRDQIIAANLAQEGIELVRNLKDNADPSFTSLALGDHDDCRIDPVIATSSSGTDIDTDPSSDKRLYMNAGKYYVHTVATPTKFYRKIFISMADDPVDTGTKKIATVTSTVIWGGSVFPANCNITSECVSVTSVMQDVE